MKSDWLLLASYFWTYLLPLPPPPLSCFLIHPLTLLVMQTPLPPPPPPPPPCSISHFFLTDRKPSFSVLHSLFDIPVMPVPFSQIDILCLLLSVIELYHLPTTGWTCVVETRGADCAVNHPRTAEKGSSTEWPYLPTCRTKTGHTSLQRWTLKYAKSRQ